MRWQTYTQIYLSVSLCFWLGLCRSVCVCVHTSADTHEHTHHMHARIVIVLAKNYGASAHTHAIHTLEIYKHKWREGEMTGRGRRGGRGSPNACHSHIRKRLSIMHTCMWFTFHNTCAFVHGFVCYVKKYFCQCMYCMYVCAYIIVSMIRWWLVSDNGLSACLGMDGCRLEGHWLTLSAHKQDYKSEHLNNVHNSHLCHVYIFTCVQTHTTKRTCTTPE